MPAIAPQFNLSESETLFVALAIGLIGYIIGSYLIGTLADRYVRLHICCFLYTAESYPHVRGRLDLSLATGWVTSAELLELLSC